MTDHVTQAGAPDPGFEEISLDMEIGSGACYFNNALYPVGQYLRSGSELLHCEERGVWVCKGGEVRPA